MASTNKTTNLQLSQFTNDDTPKWLQDYNDDMEKIDAFSRTKGQANGLASLNENGKLAQMPTAADVGALSVDAISSGNNTNGSWVKFPDGTMVCYGSKSLSGAIPSQGTTDFTIPLPQTFIAAPKPQVSIFHDTGVNYTVRARAATTTQIKIGVYNPSQYESTGTIVSWFVIGKWK